MIATSTLMRSIVTPKIAFVLLLAVAVIAVTATMLGLTVTAAHAAGGCPYPRCYRF